ncbi:hypothetical protein [Rhodobacter viridis]|uniref:hypothetical protein n=1 Tax=Rhodobacter viridis TaxID=1054202 RepID=UPI000DA146CD|nr:hypothetical protein [Rhodobacter viridis]
MTERENPIPENKDLGAAALSSGERADIAYKTALIMEAKVPGSKSPEANAISSATTLGRNVLHEELGRFGSWDGAIYDLDDETRDRLLAHARQDSASAYSLAIFIAKQSAEASRAARRAARLTTLVLCINLIFLAGLVLLLS